MNSEEIEVLVPDKLNSCSRCGGEARKSMYFETDDEVPMGWTVNVYCDCGIQSRRMFISKREAAVDALRKLVAWWNERPIREIHKCGLSGCDGLG